MVKASGSTVGLPDLRAGSVVMIDGAGKRFSGRYFVTATTHAIGDGGYTTQFECRREEQ
jgi:phage protein D